MIVVPTVALIFDPKTAVVMHALIEIPVIAQLLPAGIRNGERATVMPMLLALIVSVPMGMYFLAAIDPDIMRLMMSSVVVLMVTLMSTGWHYKQKIGLNVSVAGGAIGGFLQGATGIGGPPIITLLMSRGDNSLTTRGNNIIMMGSIMLVSLATQYLYGFLNQQIVLLSLCLAPIYALTTYLGSRFFNRGGDRFYRGIALALLAVTAVATFASSLVSSIGKW